MISSLFLNADSKEDKATFHYEFLLDEDEVTYEYSKKDINTLATEQLSINGSLIFKYNFKAYYDKNNTKYIVPNIYAFEPYDDRKLQIDYALRQKNFKCWC